jgi:FkbM family methyltransferase
MSDFTFAEHGEDILFHRLLLWKERGYYIDCGAYHSRHMSMTARLRNFGWTGLNIDIDEQVCTQLKSDIPQSTTICAAIGPTEGRASFYKYQDAVINTTDPCQHAHLEAIARRGELFTQFIGVEEVRTTSIERLVSELGIEDGCVDYLNIDIEGVELDALRGFPWDKQGPKVISVEIHRLDLTTCSANPAVLYMASRGYVLQSYVFHTAIFTKSEFDTELCHRAIAKNL